MTTVLLSLHRTDIYIYHCIEEKIDNVLTDLGIAVYIRKKVSSKKDVVFQMKMVEHLLHFHHHVVLHFIVVLGIWSVFSKLIEQPSYFHQVVAKFDTLQ